MGKINSRQKGAAGEREFANFLTDHGHEARRGQQFSGSPDSPDVVCKSLNDFNIEVKRREKFSLNNVYEAIAKALEDDPDRWPMIAYRSNGKKWMICMDAEDFLDQLEPADD
tara:strand:+ start:227 stop:562 length:336 start_codon:yes stop_codon:yes gene_type:complete